MKRHALLFALACFVAQAGFSQTLRVLASNGIRALIEDVQPAAEIAAGRRLDLVYDSTTALKQKIALGEQFDAVVLTTEGVNDLLASKRVTGPASIARAGIGVGVKAGAPKPDIRTPESFKQALLKTKSITYADDGASKQYILKMFADFGIADLMKSKTAAVQGSTNSTARVVDGKSEMVLTLTTEIIPVKGMRLVGPFPASLQHYIEFSAATATDTKDGMAAKALIAFLKSSAIAPSLKAKGMEPAAK